MAHACTLKQRNGKPKKRFRSEIDAKLALARIWRQNGDQQREYLPKRAYYHSACHGWHLTHTEARQPVRC
jgi:hypothetical protein